MLNQQRGKAIHGTGLPTETGKQSAEVAGTACETIYITNPDMEADWLTGIKTPQPYVITHSGWGDFFALHASYVSCFSQNGLL